MSSQNSKGFNFLASGFYTPEKHIEFMEWLKDFEIRYETTDDEELLDQEFEDYIFLAEKCFQRTEKQWRKI
jgi:hypothetical protein